MVKKLSLLLSIFVIFLFISCSKYTKFDVKYLTTAYITSEVQEKTHDMTLAYCDNDIYVEVPDYFNSNTVNLVYTNRIIWYTIRLSDGFSIKVSNKGYEYPRG